MGLAAWRSAHNRCSSSASTAVWTSLAPWRVARAASWVMACSVAVADSPSTSISSTASACDGMPVGPSVAATSRKVRSNISQAVAPSIRASTAQAVAASNESKIARIVAVAPATGISASSTSVKRARVPSLPTNRSTRCPSARSASAIAYPDDCFRTPTCDNASAGISRPTWVLICAIASESRRTAGTPIGHGASRRTHTSVPSSNTHRTPRTHGRVAPNLSVRAPAALAPTIPPIVQNRPLEGSTGKRSPSRRAASSISPRVAPAPTRIRRASTSTGPSSRKRLRSTITPGPTAPAAMPLPEPRGISATPSRLLQRMSAGTSSASAGTATAAGTHRAIPAPSAYIARASRSVRNTPRKSAGDSITYGTSCPPSGSGKALLGPDCSLVTLAVQTW